MPGLGMPLSFAKITENGALGDARQASGASGLEMTDAVVTRSVAFLEQLLLESTTR